MGDKPRRRLIIIPVIHSQEDMGRLRESVRRLHGDKHGEHQWDEHVRAVEALWQEIRRGIDAMGLDLDHVRLYQDGLPICGKEQAIIGDLAGAGSENHRLLADLMAAGARVEGTESPELLLREYEFALAMLGMAGGKVTPEAAREFERTGRELLQKRDRFIADRIDQTLQPGEVGLIFLGMLHTLPPHLPPDIVVERLGPNELPKMTRLAT